MSAFLHATRPFQANWRKRAGRVGAGGAGEAEGSGAWRITSYGLPLKSVASYEIGQF
jgi:hypothetical protein